MSLHEKIKAYDREHAEMWDCKAYDVCRGIMEFRGKALLRIRDLEREIKDLMAKARQISAIENSSPAASPLELLGISAILKADGKITDAQYTTILNEVCRGIDRH
jgi:hypothetical protein